MYSIQERSTGKKLYPCVFRKVIKVVYNWATCLNNPDQKNLKMK